MAWGVLDDYKLTKVPGTTLFNKKGLDLADGVEVDPNIKKSGSIILIPQPSDSINDPLNWSLTRKNVIIWILSIASGLTASLGPMVTPGFGEVAATYHVSFNAVSISLVGVLTLVTGTFTFFTSAAATVWGKRPIFIISMVVLLMTSVWGFYATSFVSLTVMRAVQGAASAPVETLVTSTVSDIFFVHQRGQKLAIWGLAILTGVLLGQVISGAIIETMGFSADLISTENSRGHLYFGEKSAMEIEIQEIEPKKTFVETLSLYDGRVSDAGFWKIAIKPIQLIVYPAVIVSTFVYASFQTWLISFSLLSVNIFSAPPYNLSSSQIGLTNLPQFFMGIAATMLAGWTADKIAAFMSRHNNGVYEPEFRLTLMIPAVFLSTIGFFGFGISVGQGLPIYWPVAFMTINSLAVPFATSANANQAFVTINFVKAIMVFAASSFINGWLEMAGTRSVFTTIGFINAGVCMLAVPIYVYGKRLRSLIARSSLAKKL
ncbi:major facilitator superfamily transporter [Botrytis cinerea]